MQNNEDFGYTSYDGLWSLMKEKDMTKKELISKSGISSEDYESIEKNIDLSLSTIRKICLVFNADYKDIISLSYASK